MKNALYFILEALFIPKMFKFLLWLFGHLGKTAWLERSAKICKNQKLLKSQPG